MVCSYGLGALLWDLLFITMLVGYCSVKRTYGDDLVSFDL